jgi:hypothetical protein
MSRFLAQVFSIVIPAKAGIQGRRLTASLDPRFRGGDTEEAKDKKCPE